MAANLSIDPVVDVIVDVSAMPAPRDGFDVGLIAGTSPVFGEGERCREYTGADALLADGFAPDAPEYLAAALYFGQDPAPRRLVVGSVKEGEDAPECLMACRAANAAWYAAYVCDAAKEDVLAAAAWMTGRRAVLFYDAHDDAPDGDEDVFAALMP